MVFGVIRAVPDKPYDQLIEEQIKSVQSKSSIKCMDDLFNSGSTWVVE
jgi:2-oxoglutarate ferredoxin oxidoreductase subunit beta